jgi:hypothetical protein
MFQVFVLNVSSVFRHMNVAYVSHICLQVFFRHECCICFTHILSSVLSRCCVCFCNGFKCFSGVFASILDACFKYFICLQTYVAMHLYILKVDRVLHLSPHRMLSRLGISSPPPSAGWTPAASSLYCRCWWRSRRHRPHVDARNGAEKWL